MPKTRRLTLSMQRTLGAISGYNGLQSQLLRGAAGACKRAPLISLTLGELSQRVHTNDMGYRA